MSALEDLDRFLADDEPAGEPSFEPPEDADTADRMLRRLGRRLRTIEDTRAAAERVIARTKAWESATTASLRSEADLLQAALRSYHEDLLDTDPKRTSVTMPAGSLRSKANPDRTEVVDEDAFVAWALTERPTLLKTEHKPVKAEIKRHLRQNGELFVDPVTGEAVPGLAVVTGDRSFWVDIDLQADADEEVGE